MDITAGELAEYLIKVGPRGYEHGWRFVGVPGDPARGRIDGSRPGESALADSVVAGARKPSELSDDQLREVDQAMTHRAVLLGKPGALIPQHKKVKAEIARRAKN